MKTLKSFLYLILATGLFFTSCQKDNLNDNGVEFEQPETEVVDKNPLVDRGNGANGDGLELDCITIDYPFAVVDVEGVTYTIASDEDLETIFTEETEILDFVYPLAVTLDDESTVDVADGEELAELFSSCLPEGGWEDGDFPAYLISLDNSCYEFVYPVTLVNLDNEETIVNDEDEFNAAVAEDLQFFVFPLSLQHEDGEVISVADTDEMFDVLFGCSDWEYDDSTDWNYENGFEYIGCYLIEFPFDVELEDGTIVTVEDHMQYCDLLLTGQIVDFVFPITLTDEEGNTVTVNSSEELEELLDDCWGEWIDELDLATIYFLSEAGGELDCYSIVYPISGIDYYGNAVSAGDQDALEELLYNGNGFYFVEYPFSVTLNEDGSIIEINNATEFFELLEDCE